MKSIEKENQVWDELKTTMTSLNHDDLNNLICDLSCGYSNPGEGNTFIEILKYKDYFFFLDHNDMDILMTFSNLMDCEEFTKKEYNELIGSMK